MKTPAPRAISRRHFLKASALAAALIAQPRLVRAAPTAKIIETRVISLDADYHGWPTLMRRRNGQLLLVYSGGREEHICPFGRVELMTSHDDGQSWSWPRVIFDSDIDDRDAGALETSRGTLLVNTASTTSYDTLYLQAAEKKQPGEAGAWDADRLKRWQAAHHRLTSDAERAAQQGAWLLRSTDGGATWSPRQATPVFTPHGPIELSDGRLLYVGIELFQKTRRLGVAISDDDGLTWQWLANISARAGDNAASYAEPHAVQAADGRIVVHVRNENPANFRETLQTESRDGGKTWSEPRPIVWGMPAHLRRLGNGDLLTSFGHRRKPFGVQACISRDHGETWSEPFVLSGDGAGADLGYPSTVELPDATLLTVWYEVLKGNPRAVLRQARWKLG